MNQNIETIGENSEPISAENKEITKLAAGATVSLGGKFAGSILQILGQIALARLLGPHLFGLYAIGWTILRIVGRIGLLGMDKGILRFAPQYKTKDLSGLKGVIFQSIGVSLLSGFIIGWIFFIAAPWIATQVFQKPELSVVFRWLAFAFPLVTGLYVLEATTRVTQRMKYSMYAEQISLPAANLVIFIMFFFLGWRLVGALVAVVFSFLIAFLLAIYYVKLLFPKILSPEVKQAFVLREILIFSLPASFAGLFGMFIVWIDRLLVGFFLSSAKAGIYQTASQSSFFFLIILSAFGAIFGPLCAELYDKQKMKRLYDVFKVSTKWSLYASLPIGLVVLFAPRNFMITLYGPQYESGWLPLLILTGGQLINLATGPVGLLLLMTGQQKKWFTLSGTAFLANFILNWILIPKWGLTGAAIGTAFSLSGLFLSGLIQARIFFGTWPYDSRYLKGITAAGLTTIALLLFQRLDISSPILTLFLTALISVSVFGLSLIIFGLDTEDEAFIRQIRGKLGGI